jgi:2-aminoadipate transaminase
VVRLKQAADLHAGALSQTLVAELVSDVAWWSGHLAEIRLGYARRAAALASALTEAFGERLMLAEPRGGMFLWGRFADGTCTADLLGRALAEGVAFVPGPEFFTRPGGQDALRLSFATNPPEQLAEAARRLAAAHAHSRP